MLGWLDGTRELGQFNCGAHLNFFEKGVQLRIIMGSRPRVEGVRKIRESASGDLAGQQFQPKVFKVIENIMSMAQSSLPMGLVLVGQQHFQRNHGADRDCFIHRMVFRRPVEGFLEMGSEARPSGDLRCLAAKGSGVPGAIDFGYSHRLPNCPMIGAIREGCANFVNGGLRRISGLGRRMFAIANDWS
jgi:hypothetical protein